MKLYLFVLLLYQFLHCFRPHPLNFFSTNVLQNPPDRVKKQKSANKRKTNITLHANPLAQSPGQVQLESNK